MKIRIFLILALSLCCALFTACEKKQDKSLPQAPAVENDIAIPEPETKPLAEEEKKSEIVLDEDILNMTEFPPSPDNALAKLTIKLGSKEEFEDSVRKITQEVSKLPPEEQARFRNVGMRIFTETIKNIMANEDLDALKKDHELGRQTFERYVTEGVREFEGRNMYEIANLVEERSQNMPPAEDEFNEILQEIMRFRRQ